MAKEYFTNDDPMWENDPQVCRDADPDWDAKVERSAFDYQMRNGESPEDAWRDLEKRKRYIAFLKEHKSPLAEG